MKTYEVRPAARPPALDGDGDGPGWTAAEPLALEAFMGERPAHFPRVQARVLYDARALYVAFRVEDRYVRAVAEHLHGEVWKDSCVEFFFTPGVDPAPGYFNLEVNCGGTFIMRHQQSLEEFRLIDPADCAGVEVYHSMPKIVNPELAGPLTWGVAYRLPLDFLSKYAPVTPPAPGVTWRANFYKCADDSSHPHWLTWSPIDWPEPRFHLPEFFGVLKFS